MTTTLSSQLPSDSSLAQHLQVMICGVAQTSCGIVIYGAACNVKGPLNHARIGTDAVIYPACV